MENSIPEKRIVTLKSLKNKTRQLKAEQISGFKATMFNLIASHSLDVLPQIEDPNHLLEFVVDLVYYSKEKAISNLVENLKIALKSEEQLKEWVAQEPDNILYLPDIISDYKKIISKCEASIDLAQSYLNDVGDFKNIRLKSGEEIILIFNRKVSRKNGQYIVGNGENGKTIALNYAYLWNRDKYGQKWEKDKAYAIKHNGKKEGKYGQSYIEFIIKEIEED